MKMVLAMDVIVTLMMTKMVYKMADRMEAVTRLIIVHSCPMLINLTQTVMA